MTEDKEFERIKKVVDNHKQEQVTKESIGAEQAADPPEGERQGESNERPKFSFYEAPISNTEPDRSLTLPELHELICDPDYKDVTEELRNTDDKNEYRKLKTNRLDFVTPSGVFKERNKDALQQYSGYIVIDFDDLDDVEGTKEKLRKDPHTLLLFTSPSGKGLKWIVPSANGAHRHRVVFKAIQDYVQDEYQIEVDDSGKDVSRACFLCHDTDAYLASSFENVESFSAAIAESDSEANAVSDSDSSEEVSEIILNLVDEKISKIEELEVDLTPLYKDWLYIGFSMASLGEAGREYYHRISRFYDDYNRDECDEKFDKLLDDHNPGGIGIEYFLRKANAVLPEDYTKNLYLPDSLYEKLPPLLKEACSHFDDPVERAMLLMGMLTVLSGCYPNVYGKYDKKRVGPNIYTMIMAPASTGKSVLSWAKKLGEMLDRELRERYEDADMDDKEELRNSLFIPCDISASAFTRGLYRNLGKGILFSTEIDTLATALGQEWGRFSDKLRKAFHHEVIDMSRQMDDEDFVIRDPHISVLLSGTPNQVNSLIGNAENGLLSRFAVLELESKPEFRDVFADDDIEYESIFEEYAQDISEIYFSLVEREDGIRFNLSEEQRKRFRNKYRKLLPLKVELKDPGISSIIKRIALIQYRLCMILTVTRQIGSAVISDKFECNDTDYQTAEQITQRLLLSSESVYERLSDNEHRPRPQNKRKPDLYNLLPDDEFKRREVLTLAEGIGVSERTLDRMLNNDRLFIRVNHGTYRKVSSGDTEA